MNCSEIKKLIGPYLDSELDTRSADDMRRHLEKCPECALLCRREQELDAALRFKLKPAAPTAALWKIEEAFVKEAFANAARHQHPARSSSQGTSAWTQYLHELLWPSPKYYAVVAVIWLLLLSFNTRPVSTSQRMATSRPKMSPESRLVLLEQRHVLKELLSAPEAQPAAPVIKTITPRSERRQRLFLFEG